MIIKSILDNDLYKFSMSYAHMKLFPEAEGTFEFFDRANTIYTDEFLVELKKELKNLSKLSMTKKELDWVKENITYIPEHYWEWLSGFNPNGNISAYLDEDRHLHISITDKMYKVEYYEVPILAIVSELRNRMMNYDLNMSEIIKKTKEKVNYSNNNELLFSEFGTRRRFSYTVQEKVWETINASAKYCTGTSNVHLAMKTNTKPVGTMAHSWVSFIAGVFSPKQANYLMMENWIKVYDGDLGIALTDTFTSKLFFSNLSTKHAKLFDGVRHDSGDPYKFVDLVVSRYKELGVDPTTKTIIFSNSLTFPDFKEIADYCKGKIRCAAGIGTNLSNDTGNKPANIVMKLVKCRINNRKAWEDCIKISDDLGKHMGNQDTLDLYAKLLKLDLKK